MNYRFYESILPLSSLFSFNKSRPPAPFCLVSTSFFRGLSESLKGDSAAEESLSNLGGGS